MWSKAKGLVSIERLSYVCVRACVCACVHACVCHTSMHNHTVHICMRLIASCIMCTCVVKRVPYNW